MSKGCFIGVMVIVNSLEPWGDILACRQDLTKIAVKKY
jgi:hypothetical protein